MHFPDDQVEELRRAYPGVQLAQEGGVPFFLLPQLGLPVGLSLTHVDALLCPTNRSGYHSTLYFASPVGGGPQRNWTVHGHIVLDRPWYGASWQTRPGLRLVQMVRAHLDLFRHP